MPSDSKDGVDPKGPKGFARLATILELAPGALMGISERDASTKAAPEEWSAKQELGHLIDSAINNHRRFVRGQIEDNPALPDYDGDGWVAVHDYQSRDWPELIRAWQFFNNWLLSAARKISESGWQRTTRLQGRGDVTLGYIFDDYVRHLQHHLRHLGVHIDADTAGDQGLYPEKVAAADAPIGYFLGRRWSPVAFNETRAVEPDKMRSLLEAARWAPSCYNEQPWRYLVFDGSDPKALEQARECLVDGNAWARTAPVLIISIASETFAANGSHNRHAEHDVGAADENLVLEAAELGLAAHQMAGYHADKVRHAFHIPEGFTPLSMIAIGYPYRGAIDALPEKIRAREIRPRQRKAVSEFAFGGSWEKPLAKD
jgi:nitroreductase